MPTEKELTALVVNEVESYELLEQLKANGKIKDNEINIVKNEKPVDKVPTKDSKNLVLSGGVFSAIEEAAVSKVDGENSFIVEGGADVTMSEALKEALPLDGRYDIEFTTEEEEDYFLPKHAASHGKDGNDQITPESIGARPDTWMPTAADIGTLTTEEIQALVSEAIGSTIGGSY